MTEDTFDLTDYLSESEIEVVNYLRGFTAEGDAIPGNWRLEVTRNDRGRWIVKQVHGDFELHGEGTIFDDAWIDQCDPALREPMTEGERQSAPSVHDQPAPKPRPMLRVIKGGRDGS